ncbi:MAG: Transcriptional regulatory protein ZraR [bacterium ADurb.Bin157]|jgi:two-component system response regulator AtoC|nr:sigma-54 dependent transcriptional regulator [Candidatus Riflebacteria bacterium]NCB46206.1 sigma-54-dependent Fis family transcriptional regulator [bacterium]NLV93639.1 sigma-54-dependent Fis family transcriptional regulator [Candidatus Riflebacteria bacterium]OQB48058.1 MAG: Transcriptional regulatory protein ZraR [bacterium ADurb.Bin157]
MTVKILIVDDEEMIRWTLKEGLECEGYEVKDFKDGRSFLEHFKRFGADIVFLDVRLPDSNGLDLLLEANKLEPEAIIIIMTAYGDVETAVTAMKRGAYDYLPKPYNLVEVNLMVHKIIQANIVKSQLHHFQERFETQFSRIIGENQKMKSLREEISIAAKADKTTVLIRGESGTGKELVARQIHFQSNRADKPFIDVNAAAVSGSLLESELFGHEKGAFTDAQKQKKGLFELANSGTLFLDEIGDLDMSLQVKLLRVLQERKFRRVGGTTDIHVDVRVISATNADLEKNIEEGRLRADLFYRLNIFSIKIPPLRERRSDILLLAKNFLDEFRKEFSKDISGFREDTIKIIENYDFPGNVRELRNIIERATLLESSNLIRPASLPEELKISSNLKESSLIFNDDVPWRSENFSFKEYIDSVEKRIVQEVLKETDNKKSKAAQMLGLTRFALRHQLKKHGIEDDDS